MFLGLFFSGLFCLVLVRKHFLMSLLSLDFFLLSLYFYIYLLFFLYDFYFFYFLFGFSGLWGCISFIFNCFFFLVRSFSLDYIDSLSLC